MLFLILQRLFHILDFTREWFFYSVDFISI